MEKSSTNSPPQFNASIRITPTSNEKLFFAYALLAIFTASSLLIDNISENDIAIPFLRFFAIAFFLSILICIILYCWALLFSPRNKITSVPEEVISTKELLIRWKDFTHDELKLLLLYAKFPRYRQYPKNKWSETTRAYNCFTTGSKLLEIFAKPDHYLNMDDVITFEATSNFFQKVTPPQTEQARICQLETQLQMADQRAIDIAHFMLKLVTDPSPIEKVTVPEYKKKFQELRKERVISPTNEGGLSQNFIIKELRPQLPRGFYNEKNIEK